MKKIINRLMNLISILAFIELASYIYKLIIKSPFLGDQKVVIYMLFAISLVVNYLVNGKLTIWNTEDKTVD